MTKSWGRKWSGVESTRCLFSTGSKDEGLFSLSSEEYELVNGSLENDGVVGVRGMSSDTSDMDVVELLGVLIAEEAGERIGVTGKDAKV